ncbi:hypothetical protein BGX26_001245 [Mortierella sp. AD094]|nr:hypothetical protein BGX26_001245 [Mortierella sp. AD094]
MALQDNPQIIAQLLERAAKHASTKFDDAESQQRQALPLKPFPSCSLSDPENEDIDPETRAFLTLELTKNGSGLEATAEELFSRIAPSLSNSIGPRYFGFVTGGVTPAAFIADWMVTTYDQNNIIHSPEAKSGLA